MLPQAPVDTFGAQSRVTEPCEGWAEPPPRPHWSPRPWSAGLRNQLRSARTGGVSGGGASLVAAVRGGSLPHLLGKDGDDGVGQEDHTGRAPDDQAQHAAVHLHGLTALSRVEEGVIRDAPAEQDTGVHVEATGPPALPGDKRPHLMTARNAS